jgi:acetyltransferase-like isoleucine patch superfamily enzyme
MKLSTILKFFIRKLQYKIQYFRSSISIDPSSYVSRKAVIRSVGGGKIVIGKNCEIHDFSMIMTYGGDIIIGDNTSVNPFTIIYGHGGTIIGSGVRLAAHSTIIPANHIFGDDETPLYKRGVTGKGIVINDYVWIASGCRILDGVTIGKHAVVGAGSVVNKSIPDFGIAVGVPAKVLRINKS